MARADAAGADVPVAPSWIVPAPHGVSIRVFAKPRASRTQVVGLHGDALAIQLAAPPVDGAANLALVEFLARALGVPRGAVRVESGSTGRNKRVDVDGVDVATALAALAPGSTR